MKGKILLALLFLGSVWIIPLEFVHASNVSTSLPGVRPGDNATYTVSTKWETDNATAFPNLFSGVNVGQTVTRIISVRGSNVTFTDTSHSLDGTPVLLERYVLDVQTESFCLSQAQLSLGSNLTSCSREVPGFFLDVLAAGLHAPDAIGADPTVILNQTVTRTILGAQRNLNFLNVTTVHPAVSPCPPRYPLGGCAASTMTRSWSWDQATGIKVADIFSVTLTSSVGSATGCICTMMASTNIWTGSDFSLIANPTEVTLQGGRPGSSTISLNSINGFTGTVTLLASTSSSQLSCSLSMVSVALTESGSSSLTISCIGSQGTYTVTLTGTAGSLSHSTTLTYTILHGHRAHHS